MRRGVYVPAPAAHAGRSGAIHAYCTAEAWAVLCERGCGCGPYDALAGVVLFWIGHGRFVGRAGEYSSLERLDRTAPGGMAAAAVRAENESPRHAVAPTQEDTHGHVKP